MGIFIDALKDYLSSKVHNWLSDNVYEPVGGWFSDRYQDVNDVIHDVPNALSNIFGNGNTLSSAYSVANAQVGDDPLTNANFFEGVANAFTGNLDYQRDLNNLAKEQAFNAEQAQIARDFEAEQAQIVRDYEERLSNTAYQRASQDMINAGYNPALMFSQGGASVPSVSVPSAYNASVRAGKAPALGSKALDNLLNIAKIVASVGASSAEMAFENKKLAQSLDIMSQRLQLMKERQSYSRRY